MTRAHDARASIELAARASYGRLLALLAVRSGDLADAEDALAEAFVAALRAWPEHGVPEKPDAWLLSAARRKLLDARRSARVREAAEALLAIPAAHDVDNTIDIDAIRDERLELLFACAHPRVDDDVRTALVLQCVIGLDAARIASAFLVSPATMSQRLVRAKARLRDADVAFESPDAHELDERVETVLEAIYAAYGSAWDDIAGANPDSRGLADEAVWLARLVVQLLPSHAEALGLLALVLHCEARRNARRSSDGAYVPLSEQDPRAWSRDFVDEAESVLLSASRRGNMGRFQLEAAIQSAHAARRETGRTDWESIALLYEGLVRIRPTIGAWVGRAAALAEARGAETGYAALLALPLDDVRDYQPYWSLRAHLARVTQRNSDAREANLRAIGLTSDADVRAFLMRRDDA